MALATLDTDHVILETLKKAEYEDAPSTAAWIVRVYETGGGSVRMRARWEREPEFEFTTWGSPEVLLKGAVLLFASAAGKHITGQILAVDGGVSSVHGG